MTKAEYSYLKPYSEDLKQWLKDESFETKEESGYVEYKIEDLGLRGYRTSHTNRVYPPHIGKNDYDSHPNENYYWKCIKIKTFNRTHKDKHSLKYINGSGSYEFTATWKARKKFWLKDKKDK